MIWVLRHIGVHLWISTLLAVPLSFCVLLYLTRLFPFINPFIVGGAIFISISSLLGFLTDLAAKKQVNNLIKEGQAWERSGIVKKAKKRYIRALRVYDTFLLWPLSAKKTALKISKVIARFQLSTQSDSQNLKRGTALYLKINPHDADIAGMWLSQIKKNNIITSFEQDVLSVLAQSHSENTTLSPMIAKIFLDLQRNDYTARKLYQQVLKQPDLKKQYHSEIIELAEEETIPMVRPAAADVMPKRPPEKKIEIIKSMQKIALAVFSFLKRTWVKLEALFTFIAATVNRLAAYIKDHKKIKFYLKAGVLGFAGAGLAFFIISTLAHTFKTRVPEKKKMVIEAAIPKPFTLQVAAYLKTAHAQRYVELLKKKGIDASVKKVAGGGKTWFVVRVSKFADKKSAADYGEKLKKDGLIDDFFVNNR